MKGNFLFFLSLFFCFNISCLIWWNWDHRMSHSIVCHHVVCCGQMKQESRDTLLLIWQCSLTAQTQRMALTTSWHSGPALLQAGQYLPSIIQQFSWPFLWAFKWVTGGTSLGISFLLDYHRICYSFGLRVHAQVWIQICFTVKHLNRYSNGRTCFSFPFCLF